MTQIWVIDDDAAIRKVLNCALKRDFEVSIFPVADEALERIIQGQFPDAIISDLWSNEGLHGHEFYQRAYGVLPAHIPRYLMTGRIRDVPKVIPDLNALGITKVIEKPFDIFEVRDSLKYDIQAAAEMQNPDRQNPSDSI